MAALIPPPGDPQRAAGRGYLFVAQPSLLMLTYLANHRQFTPAEAKPCSCAAMFSACSLVSPPSNCAMAARSSNASMSGIREALIAACPEAT